MKRKKCMADGGMVDKVSARVKQAAGGIADFLRVGKPNETYGGPARPTRTNDDGRPIVHADTRPDMPQERNPRRFADEGDQRKEARRGGYQQGGLLRDDSATRINQASQPGMAAQVSSLLSGVPDAARAPTQQFGQSLAQSAAPVGQTPQSQGLLTGIKDYGTTPAQLANSGQPAFVNTDGTPRNMGAPSPVSQPAPVLTMKDRDIAAGVDPNRAYRPGTAADPYASGIRGAAVPATAGTAANLDRQPMGAPNLRNWRQQRTGGYADGGIVQFAGKGGPRDDQIPVAVAGNKINVSDGEAAVILPAKTAANAAALGIIGGLIEATNDGRKPKMGMRDGGKYARGVVPDDEELRRSQGVIGGPAFVRGETPPPASMQLAQGQVGGQPFVQQHPVAGTPTAKPITAPEMYAPAYEAVANVPAAAGGIASTIMNALPEGGYLKDPAFREKAGRLIAGEGMFPGGLTGIANTPQQTASKQPVAAQPQPQNVIGNEGRGSAIAPISAVPRTTPADQPQNSGATTRNSVVQTDMGRGFDPTKLQMAPGYGMASNAAGKTLSVAPSQYVAADGSTTSRWEDTQQYKDAIARNEADKIRLAEMQAARRGADPMAIQASRQGIASAVLQNQVTREQMQRNAESQALLQTAMATKDPAQHRVALQNYLASRGVAMKDADDWEVKSGGQRVVPNGMGGQMTVDLPPVAFNKRTREKIGLDVSAGQAGGTSQADEIKAQMQAGKITREQAVAELRKMGYQ